VEDAHPKAIRPLRLALYGAIHATSGSSATSFFALAREWLRQGHMLDLYSPGHYLEPADLTEWPNFRFISIHLATWKQATRLVPANAPTILRASVGGVLAEAQRKVHEAEVASAILERHAREPYDALVVLNMLSRFTLPDGVIPVVSFPQGPPNGESEFIRRRGDIVRAECGRSGWVILRAGYKARDPAVIRSLKRSTFIVASSEWSASFFEREGWPRSRMATLCPPIDLNRFVLTARPASVSRFTFLWLGRIVPRKRFALALDAFAKLRARRPSVRLVVIGSAGYAGMVKMHLPDLARFEGVERGRPVPNDRVPELMAGTDAILQPSENENFGLTAAEAAACGVPTVLGPTNGTAESLEDAAFRFDRYEPDDVAAAMERVMDAVLADPVGIAHRARAIAERNLSLTSSAQRGAEILRQVADDWHADHSTR
jgi:glycosyltransferase involved in cell wall biosynthesis